MVKNRFITSNPRDGSVYPLPAPAESVVKKPVQPVSHKRPATGTG
jgi:hypothetical protein